MTCQPELQITRHSQRFATCPQVMPEDIPALAKHGYRTIVCNRPDGEVADQPPADAIEREAVRAGLAFHYLPIAPGEMREQDVRRMLRILDESGEPGLAYCRSGARSTKLWERACELADVPGAGEAR